MFRSLAIFIIVIAILLGKTVFSQDVDVFYGASEMRFEVDDGFERQEEKIGQYEIIENMIVSHTDPDSDILEWKQRFRLC